MSFNKNTHKFSAELQALCADGEDVEDKRSPTEIKRSKVKVLKTLAKDALAQQCSCLLKESGISATVTKIVKKKITDADKLKLFASMAAMAQIEDEHLVKVLGVVTAGNPLMVVTANCDSNLEEYVLERHGSLTVKQRLQMLAELADGMAGLESCSWTHGRLSARHCYSAEGNMVFKVGGVIGLGRDERWTAPEVLGGAPATPASDIWAFGVMIVYVFGDGSPPYPAEWSSAELLAKLQGGERLPRPAACPEEVYDIACKTWDVDPAARPDFFWLRAELEDRQVAAE